MKQTIRKTTVVLMALVLLVVLALGGCDEAGAGDGDTIDPAVANAASALDAVWSSIGVSAIGYEQGGLSGVGGGDVVDLGPGSFTQTFTFTNAVDPLTDYAISGSITNTITESHAAGTLTLTWNGTITLTGAPVAELILSTTFVLDAVNGTMTQSGTLTADGTEYDFSTFDITAGKAGEHSPQIIGVWKGTDEPVGHPTLPSFVGFGLPGNFLLPMSYDETEEAYINGGSPVAMYYDATEKMLVSNDGSFWKCTAGFSADGNTMTLSSGTDDGMIWVYRAADAATSIDTWWQGSWNHEMFVDFGDGAQYNDFTFDFNLVDVTTAGPIAYSGHMFAESLDPANSVSGTATMSVNTSAGTFTLSDSSTSEIPNGTFRYATMGDFFVISQLETEDPRIFIVERQ